MDNIGENFGNLLFQKSCAFFQNQMKKRIKETNISRSNSSNPHFRDANVLNTHLMVFPSLIGSKLREDEKEKVIKSKRLVKYVFNTLERTASVFDVPLVCFHKSCLLYTSPSPRDS